MSGWAERLLAQGLADDAALAEAERVLEAARLRPGDTVLDVGAGLGLLTLAAHDRIGDGWVIAVDPSAAALEELLRLAHAVGSPGVMYLVGDADVLPLPDASVDAAVLRSALADAADTAVVAGELARVLRPGGRLSLCEPLDGLDADSLAGRLEAAGFTQVGTAVEDAGAEPQLFLTASRPL